MRILIGSPAFPPSMGGLERVVEQLATGLAARGDHVTVLTRTPSKSPDNYPFRVIRCPGASERVRWLRQADVFLQANLAIRDLWPLLLVRRPWVVSHHGLYGGSGWRNLGKAAIKLRLAQLATARIAVSHFLAERLGGDAKVIPNPYRADVFRRLEGEVRDRDLVFVGRLVSEKGCDGLISAVAHLAADGFPVSLTVVGDGPERAPMEARANALGLADRIEFSGALDGESLVRVLNRSQILVVPSIVEEGFGVVVLEGIACGCVVAGAALGGLPEAIGLCGRTFPPGDDVALAKILRELLTGDDLDALRESAAQQLELNRPERVVESYRTVLEQALRYGR